MYLCIIGDMPHSPRSGVDGQHWPSLKEVLEDPSATVGMDQQCSPAALHQGCHGLNQSILGALQVSKYLNTSYRQHKQHMQHGLSDPHTFHGRASVTLSQAADTCTFCTRSPSCFLSHVARSSYSFTLSSVVVSLWGYGVRSQITRIRTPRLFQATAKG